MKLPHQHPQGFHLAQKMAHETRKRHLRILRLMSIEHVISNVEWEIKLTYSDTTCLHLDSHRYRYRLAWRSTTFSLELFCPSLVIIVPRFGNYCPQVWGIIVPKLEQKLPKSWDKNLIKLGRYWPSRSSKSSAPKAWKPIQWSFPNGRDLVWNHTHQKKIP